MFEEKSKNLDNAITFYFDIVDKHRRRQWDVTYLILHNKNQQFSRVVDAVG